MKKKREKFKKNNSKVKRLLTHIFSYKLKKENKKKKSKRLLKLMKALLYLINKTALNNLS